MYMGKSFKDSLKLLEADIQHANTMASELRRERDGACLQMRMSYNPTAHLFLFLIQWADCHLAGALGLLRVLIYKVYVDGTTTMSSHERKASIREFYAIIYPSLLQFQGGLSDTEHKRQKVACMERYRRREEDYRSRFSDIEFERDDDCGICMEPNDKVVLPNCSHMLCNKCYRGWRIRSQSCPFCRDSLERVNSEDLWVFTDSRDIIDMVTITRDNLHRLFASWISCPPSSLATSLKITTLICNNHGDLLISFLPTSVFACSGLVVPFLMLRRETRLVLSYAGLVHPVDLL